ncbi:DUF2007 domain-containing protein [Vibrio fluvialis]
MKIFIAANPTEAHLLCELLKQANIACEVRGEGLFGLRGELPMNDETAPYIWLYDVTQHERAQAIIEDYQSPSSSSRSTPWQCTHCGELNERQFAVCWHCGTADDLAD